MGADTVLTGLDDRALGEIRRVLVFSAHPDDVDFGVAGTVAQLTDRGVEVTYAIVTDGDAGGFDAETHGDITETRHEEQREAAAAVGVSDVRFMGYRDGYVEPSIELIKDMVAIIRDVRPDVVISMHPERDWNRLQKSHPDHLASGEAVVRAVYPASENQFAFPELAAAGLDSYRVPWLWLYAGPSHLENFAVDVTSTVDRKMSALRHHLSQHPDIEGMERNVRAGLEENATRFGKYGSAELFHVVGVNTPSTFAGF